MQKCFAPLLSFSYPVFVDDYGLETVQEYVYLRSNAELSVRNLLKDVARRACAIILSAVEDDGSLVSTIFSFSSPISLYQIQLRVEIDENTGSAVLDFQGTGCEVRESQRTDISRPFGHLLHACDA
jgi:5-oxoprolinase (ATP-hydrolysing)